jgi:hypothetical protein
MNTPLHIAIRNGNIEIVKALLSDGCDLGAHNDEGLTPLDLAAKLNHDEIVRLLLERGAGHLPPPPTGTIPLDPPQRKKRISTWTMFVFLSLGILTLFGIAHSLVMIGALSSNLTHLNIHRITMVVDVFYFFFLVPGLAAYFFCYFFYIFRIWEEVPRELARTTPGLAAGLSLIPFFSWYWMFVALGGLYQDMNKAMESYGREKRFNVTLIIAACVVWLVSDLISIMLGTVMGIVSTMDVESPFLAFSHFVTIVGSVLWCIFSFVIFWIIRKNVREFVDIKSGDVK